METNTILYKDLLKTAKASCLLLLLFLTVNCSNTEPAFAVKGDQAITKDIIVNVEMMQQDGNRINTAYYKGKSYDIDNQNTLRYSVYVSYQNCLFYRFEMDNLHHKIKGEPINEIIIEKKDRAITVSYKGLKGMESTKTALKPAELFFTNENKAKKHKFITLYNQ